MGKSILVTGSNGFIGKAVVLKLRNLGYIVEEFDVNNGDIVDYSFSYSSLNHIIHLASKSFVPASWENPYDFYKTNVLGTANILELCRKHDASLTYISSYVYGLPQYLPVDEYHPISPASPYNHSKLVAEDICKYYAENFNLNITILRPINIYGPEQNSEFLIPTIINQVLNSKKEIITVKDLRPRRDYLYIDDFIDALLKTINLKGFQVYNIGSGYSISVEEIIQTALRISGYNKKYTSEQTERKNEIWDVYFNLKKISERLAWCPKTSFEEGIKKILDGKFKTR
jgi:nucleoside-diphosphate-sugar epimerase